MYFLLIIIVVLPALLVLDNVKENVAAHGIVVQANVDQGHVEIKAKRQFHDLISVCNNNLIK